MSKRNLCIALGSLHPLSKGYQDYLENEAVLPIKTIKQNDVLLMPGIDQGRLILLLSGSCKAYWLDENNAEHNFMYWEPGGFVQFPKNFCIGQPNEELYIKMIADSEVLIISADQLNEIHARFPEAKVQMKKIDEVLIALRDKHLLMLMLKERDRYAYFVKSFYYVYRMLLPERELCQFMNVCRKTLSIGKTNWVLKDRKR